MVHKTLNEYGYREMNEIEARNFYDCTRFTIMWVVCAVSIYSIIDLSIRLNGGT